MSKLIINGDADYRLAEKEGTLAQATQLEVWYCNAVTSIDAPQATQLAVRYCNAVISIDAPQATQLEVWYCNAVTSIDAPQATQLAVWDCNAITSIDAPQATQLKVWNCNAVTSIDAPQAAQLEVRHCDAVTSITVGNKLYRVQNVDGYATEMSLHKDVGSHLLYRGLIVGAGLHSPIIKKCKVVRLGDHWAHGETYREALQDARFKASPSRYDADELRTEIKRRGTITPSDFHLVTGACLMGMRTHLEGRGLDPHAAEMPLEAAMGAMSGTSYGNTFQKFLNP